MLAGLAYASGSSTAQRFDFRFSQGAFRDDEIFDSATSGPSRYLLEIGRRLLAASPGLDHVAIANPLLPVQTAQLAEWAAACPATAPAILTDGAGFPAAYLLPRPLFEAGEKWLLLLSCVDSGLDARLLDHLTGRETGRHPLRLPGLDFFPAMSANGWLNPDRRLRALPLQTQNALAVIEARPDWRSLPFAAFHPYHAGDVLFFALASQRARPLLFDQQIVCRAFADVVAAARPAIEAVILDQPPLPRDGSMSKYRYFVESLASLGDAVTGASFILFARLFRMHHFTPFHLIDHARFTLGDGMNSLEHSLYRSGAVPLRLAEMPLKPMKILFHLNGGWPLKTYPLEHAQTLIRALANLGCAVSVLDRPDLAAFGATSVAGGRIDALAERVAEHHLFVGVDSLPVHFAHLLAGRPTLALFGSTRPCNHDAPRGPGYRALSGSLPCSSCLTKTGCPILGGEDCANYPPPQQILSALFELSLATYGVVPG